MITRFGTAFEKTVQTLVAMEGPGEVIYSLSGKVTVHEGYDRAGKHGVSNNVLIL